MNASLQSEFVLEIKDEGADIISIVDITGLGDKQNQGYPIAILIGMILSAEFINTVSMTPDYVKVLKEKNFRERDDFHVKESQTDWLADYTADYLVARGFSAISQSEEKLMERGNYNQHSRCTVLPHKTIARLAGIGWIGKHDLIVSPDYGSAISFCTVLTNAPLETTVNEVQESKCNKCKVCMEVCLDLAIKGQEWSKKRNRDDMVDVSKCTTCLKCLVLCPWTQKFKKRNL